LVIRQINIALILLLFSTFMALEAAADEFETNGFNQQVNSTSTQKLILDWPSILRLYAGLDSQSLWHDGETLNERGRLLLSRIIATEADGLDPYDYHLERLWQLPDSSLAEVRVLRELLLTDGYLRLAVDLRHGNQAARILNPFWKFHGEAFDPVESLLDALQQEQFAELLENLSPQAVDYGRLRQALVEYRRIERLGGWRRLKSDRSLRPGDRDSLVTGLRERLAQESGLTGVGIEDLDLYDSDLVAAVEGYQLRHGLEPDGVVGPATLEALNVPVSRRIGQLRANLERWRWLPHELEGDYLLVNTAGFEFSLRSNNREVFTGRTINGRVERQTPPLISQITHLVANPHWTLPRRISVQDILPRQQQNPEFLSSKKIRVYQRIGGELQEFDPQLIDWSLHHENNFPFVLKQDAGPGNSLGRVKFYLPNRHAVFLHDTPAIGLFQHSRRAFSSGCVRIEGADRLARLLITRADPWDVGRYSRAMETGETLWIPLAEPVPVYLTYFTSWVDAAGEVHFRPDIYRRDTDLMSSIGHEELPVAALRSG
jgi:murein L,D-transpeptidase YcbB/YkuD